MGARGQRSGETSAQVVAVGGALAVVLLAVAQHIWAYDPPPGLEGALTVILSTVAAWYLPARRQREIPVSDASGTPRREEPPSA